MLESSKVVSVCLVKGTGKNLPTLWYRFGRLGAPELVFPKSSAGSLRKFRYAHYSRPQVERTELAFSNAGVEYSVFDYYDGEERPMYARGVGVTENGKDRDFRCRAGVISNLIELEKLVPCDAENALASCK